jgi:hypothetical protein
MGKVFVQTNEADGNRVIAFEGGEKTARSPSLKASRPAARATVFRTSRPKARSSLRREGQAHGLVVPVELSFGSTFLAVCRQRPQRDLLGGCDRRRLRVHDELRGRRRLKLVDRRERQPHARGRRRRHRVRGAGGPSRRGLEPRRTVPYAIDADSRQVFGWSVEGGKLSPIGSWDGIPATVAGLAAS